MAWHTGAIATTHLNSEPGLELPVGNSIHPVNANEGTESVRTVYTKNGESQSVPMNKGLTETLMAIRIGASMSEVVLLNSRGTLHRLFRSVFE